MAETKNDLTIYQDILVNVYQDNILVITLNRPDYRNALRNQSLFEITQALHEAATSSTINAVVIYGGPIIFAAGADINEMAQLNAIGASSDVRPEYWKIISSFKKPLLGAVNGYALGAGCELVMHMDIVIAGDGAKFGQPEINLGTMPGAGGTQRLIKSVGKSLAMKMVLSGEMIDANTALAAGLVAEVVPDDYALERTLTLAKVIAGKSPLAVSLAKEAMLLSFEVPLSAGLNAERKSFSLLAASDDRKEGITAFREKRKPVFLGK
jgi:enoyl-CoA hydratase